MSDNKDRQLVGEAERSKLMRHETIKWLKKRYQETSQKKYLLLPQQVKIDNEYRLIFQTFDENNSMSLDIKELYQILYEFGIKVNKKDMIDLFETIDQQSDHILSYEEFKKCATSEISDEVFRKIIRKVIENQRRDIERQMKQEQKEMVNSESSDDEEKKKIKDIQKQQDIEEKLKYYPMTFGAMMQYLSYQMKRKNLMQKINQNQDIAGKFTMIKELINMQSAFDNEKKGINVSKHKISSNKKLQNNEDRFIKVELKKETQNDASANQNINTNRQKLVALDSHKKKNNYESSLKISGVKGNGWQIGTSRDFGFKDKNNTNRMTSLRSNGSGCYDKFDLMYEKKMQLKQNQIEQKQQFIKKRQKQAIDIAEQLKNRTKKLDYIKTCQQWRQNRKISQIDLQNIQFMNQYKADYKSSFNNQNRNHQNNQQDDKKQMYSQFMKNASNLRAKKYDFISMRSQSNSGMV